MKKYEEKIEENLKAKETKERRTEHWSRHPLFVACISYGVLAAVVLLLGNYLQKKNWEEQEKMRADLYFENWKKQNEINSKDIIYRKRTEIFKKSSLLFRERESYIWNLIRARKMKDDDLGLKYWERIQKINREWEAFVREVKALYLYDLDRS